MTATPPKKSDLGVRTLSAVVMVAVAGTALWLGGWVWTAFVAAVALGVLWEWWGLTRTFRFRISWNLAGVLYVGLASIALSQTRLFSGIQPILLLTGSVIATDVGAYFAGRSIGGPKIAPQISPSKTWAGLGGGILGAFAVWAAWIVPDWCKCADIPMSPILFSLIIGAIVAVVAQSGDFFESWMKRRAGVKDSGHLIPGHGGLFDRMDGMLAVWFIAGLLWLPGLLSRT